MAKTAKRRGRPPGSKNKKSIGKSVATMDIAQLRAHIDSLQGVLAKKVSEQRAYFEGQLSQLGGYVATRTSAVVKAVTPGKGKASQGEAKISEQEKQVGKVVRPRHDPGLDARGDEGHQADQGRLPHQVGAARSLTEEIEDTRSYPAPFREPGFNRAATGQARVFGAAP